MEIPLSLWRKQLLSYIFGKRVLRSNHLSIKTNAIAVWPSWHRAVMCSCQAHSSCDGIGGLPMPGSWPMDMEECDWAPFLCLTCWWGITSSLSLPGHIPKHNQI